MADKSANPGLVTNVAEILASGASYYKDIASPEDKDRYRRRIAELDLELALDADRYLDRSRALEEELKKDDLNEEVAYQHVRDLIARGTAINEKRGEYQALAAITGSSAGDGMRNAGQVIHGGDLFASIDMPVDPTRRAWLRDSAIKRLVTEDQQFTRRQETALNEQNRSAEQISTVGRGRIAERERQICGYNEAISIHERYNLEDAKRERKIVEGLKRDNVRDAKRLFEDFVINGARFRGQSVVWNTLLDSPTIGAAPAVTPGIGATPTQGGAVNGPATGNQNRNAPPASTPPTGSSDNATAVDSQFAATALGQGTPAGTGATPPADGTATPAPDASAAASGTATTVASPPANASSPPAAPVKKGLEALDGLTQALIKLENNSSVRPQTVADVVNEFGYADMETYTPEVAGAGILKFLSETSGLEGDTVVNLNDPKDLILIAQAVALCNAYDCDIDEMKKARDIALNPNSQDTPEALIFAAIEEQIHSGLETKRQYFNNKENTDNFTPQAVPTNGQTPPKEENEYLPYIAGTGAAVALGVIAASIYTIKKRRAAEAELKKAEDDLKKLKTELRAEEETVRKLEKDAKDARTALDAEKETAAYKALSTAEKEAKESTVAAKEEEARKARESYTKRLADASLTEADLKDRADDLVREKKGLEMSRKDLVDRLDKARKKIVDAQNKLEEQQRKLDIKRSKDPYGDFSEDEKTLAEKRAKLREALVEHDKYEEEILRRRSEHYVAGNAKAKALLDEARRLGVERDAIHTEQDLIDAEQKKNTEAFKNLRSEREKLEGQKGKISGEDYKNKLADIETRWAENKAKVEELAERAKDLKAREEKLKADRTKFSKDMDTFKKEWVSRKDVAKEAAKSAGKETLAERAWRILGRDKGAEEILDGKKEPTIGLDDDKKGPKILSDEDHVRIRKEVEAETATERKALADLIRQRRYEQNIHFVEGNRWFALDGTEVKDGVTRTLESQAKLLEDLATKVEESQKLVSDNEKLALRQEEELKAAHDKAAETEAKVARERSIRLVNGEWRITGEPVNDGLYRTVDGHQAHVDSLLKQIETGRGYIENSRNLVKQAGDALTAERERFFELEDRLANEKSIVFVDGKWQTIDGKPVTDGIDRNPEAHADEQTKLQNQIAESEAKTADLEKALNNARAEETRQRANLAELGRQHARESSIRLVDGEWRFALPVDDREYRTIEGHQKNLNELNGTLETDKAAVLSKQEALDQTKAKITEQRETLTKQQRQYAFESGLSSPRSSGHWANSRTGDPVSYISTPHGVNANAVQNVYELTEGRKWESRTLSLDVKNPFGVMIAEVHGRTARLGETSRVPISAAIDGVETLQISIEGMKPEHVESLRANLTELGVATDIRTASDGGKRLFTAGESMARLHSVMAASYVREPKYHTAYLEKLDKDIDEARKKLQERERILTAEKQAAILGTDTTDESKGPKPDTGTETDTADDKDTTEGDDKKPLTEKEFLEKQEKDLKKKLEENRRKQQLLVEERGGYESKKVSNPTAERTLTEREAALQREHDLILKQVRDNATNIASYRAHEERGIRLEEMRRSYDADIAEHQKQQDQLDADRKTMVDNKKSMSKDDYAKAEEEINKRTETLKNEAQALKERSTAIADTQRVQDMRRPTYPVPEAPTTKMGLSLREAINEAAHYKGSVGAVGVMGAMNLYNRFNAAGWSDFTDDRTRTAAIVATGADFGSMVYDYKALQHARTAANASKLLAVGTATDDALMAASRTLGAASKGSKLFGAPAAIGVGLAAGTVESVVAVRAGDAGRAANAVTHTVGGVVGGVAAGVVGLKAGAAAGAAVGVWFGGIGAVPASIIGGAVGFVVGAGIAYGGAILGGKALNAVAGSAVKRKFEESMGLNEKLIAAIVNLDEKVKTAFGITTDDGVSAEELDKVKRELEARHITSIRDLSQGDHQVSAQDLAAALSAPLQTEIEKPTIKTTPVPIPLSTDAITTRTGLDSAQATNPFNESSGASAGNGFAGTTLAGLSWRKDTPRWS